MVTSNANNIRKAAIVLRSLDADTAARLLAQFSPAEARDVRLAIESLGAIDAEEQADVSAEFRRVGPLAKEDPRLGVELDFSSLAGVSAVTSVRSTARPFEFLENARVESLVPYLAREQAQTIAVVLSYLAPARAAKLLAALPERLQAEALDRLSILGDTDPGSLQILERELADWVARQQATRTRPTQRTDTVAAILAAADQHSRGEILANLIKHNRDLAQQLTPPPPEPPPSLPEEPSKESTVINQQSELIRLPQLHIDDLARMDRSTLTAVLRAVDTDVLVLALAGASDAVVERLTDEMPRKVAAAFRQRLSRLGPTRLRDVEAAQQEVAHVAARVLHARHSIRNAVTA